MRTCVTIRLPQGPTLARFSAGRLVQTENFAGSLFEAGVEAGRGQGHAVGQLFDDGADRSKAGVRKVENLNLYFKYSGFIG